MNFDPGPGARYASTAAAVALSNILNSFENEPFGVLRSWTVRVDESGTWWLEVVFRSARHGDAEVRWSGVILHASGPDKDPETSGMLYASALVEHLFINKSLPQPGPDGIADLP